MPKYYCEYCGIYLLNSSPFIRKEHNNGKKHQFNRKKYYEFQTEQQENYLQPLSHIDTNLQTVLQGGQLQVPNLLVPNPGTTKINMPLNMKSPEIIPSTLQQGGIKNLPVPNQYHYAGGSISSGIAQKTPKSIKQ